MKSWFQINLNMWVRIIIWNHDKSQTFSKAWFEIRNHDFNSKSTIFVVTYILFILFTKKQFIENINLV